MDPTAIIGYVVVFLMGAGKRFADKTIDALLEKILRGVEGRLGGDPDWTALKTEPLDEEAHQRVEGVLALISNQHHAFAKQLRALLLELDDRGAKQLIQYAQGPETVVGINEGVIVRNGVVHFGPRGSDIDLSGDPSWVKITFAIGLMLAMAGFGLFGYSFFASDGGPGDPAAIATPATVFFAGLVLTGMSQIGHTLTKPAASGGIARRPVAVPGRPHSVRRAGSSRRQTGEMRQGSAPQLSSCSVSRPSSPSPWEQLDTRCTPTGVRQAYRVRW